MAKLKLGDATAPATPSPAPLVLEAVGESADGSEIICAFTEATPEPARPRAIVFAPPPDSPAAFADWLRDEVVPKLAHLSPADLAERVSRIVLEHESKMFGRIAYHAGRVASRLGQGITTGHDKDLDAIRRMAAPAPAPTPAVVPTEPDANSQGEQQPATESPLGVTW